MVVSTPTQRTASIRYYHEMPLRTAVITGVDFNNRNLGVSALGLSALALLAPRLKRAMTVLDYGVGTRAATADALRHANITDPSVKVTCRGFRQTRRLYAGDSTLLAEIAIRTHLPLGGPASTIRSSCAVFDASGGDSFADIYGVSRYDRIARVKKLTLAMKCPLVLLPQTYGPFNDPAIKRDAAEITKRATCAVARDAHSYEILKDLLGSSFDASRHLCGTDMAFRLPTISPSSEALDVVTCARTLAAGAAVVGFNISGLLANDPASWSAYGFKDNYLDTCCKVVTRLLQGGAGAVVLLPHVLGDKHFSSECDIAASNTLKERLAPALRNCVLIAKGYRYPTEAKAIIQHFDWFSGSRLHATIGALSNGVPTATISYSDKAKGIFEACGVGDTVADPRVLSGDAVVEHQLNSFANRAQSKAALTARLRIMLQTVDSQMDSIVALLTHEQRWK